MKVTGLSLGYGAHTVVHHVDLDLPSGSLTAILGQQAANGVVTLHSDGSFSYVPAVGFLGLDSFTYRANDGGLNSAETTVLINVTTVTNTPPTVVTASYVATEDTPLVISLPRRMLRVREMTPICLTAQNRRSCPAATNAAPVAMSGQVNDNGGARSSGRAGTIGSHDRFRNAHAPACGSTAQRPASAFDTSSEGLIGIRVRKKHERIVNG